jgi:hypothetical protein
MLICFMKISNLAILKSSLNELLVKAVSWAFQKISRIGRIFTMAPQ